MNKMFDPNYTVPTASPPQASDNRAASTAFVQSALSVVGFNGWQALSSVANLQASTILPGILSVSLMGYYAAGDGGQALYHRAPVQSPGLGKIQSADGTWWQIVDNPINVLQFGAKGDGVTNDTTAIQNAINYASGLGGGTVKFPQGKNYIAINLSLVSYVVLVGGEMRSTGANATLTAAGTGIIVDTPVAQQFHMGCIGLNFVGLGAGTPCKGVRFQGEFWCQVKQCWFNNFADEGLAVLSGGLNIADVFEDLLLENCVLNRTRAGPTGAFDIDGSDHYCSRIESTVSLAANTISNANLYCVGIVIRQANGFMNSMIGEFSDIGIQTLAPHAALNRIVGCRADTNGGHGYQIQSADQFIGNLSLNNSSSGNNLYDGFNITGVNAIYVGNEVSSTGSPFVRWAFNESAVVGNANKNWHVDEFAQSYFTGAYTFGSPGSALFNPVGTPRPLAANSATSDVSGYYSAFTNSSVPTTLTNLSGGIDGGKLTLYCADNNTSIQFNAGGTGAFYNWVNPGAWTMKLQKGVFYQFFYWGGWGLASFDPTAPVQTIPPDPGDASKSVSPGIDCPTQIFNTPLTASRSLTIGNPPTNAWYKFRVVRTAASTGASGLFVNAPSTLKVLGAGSWMDAEWDSTTQTWFETASGSL